MLKKKLSDLVRKSEAGPRTNFEIINDPGAALLMGGEACGHFTNCNMFNPGNDTSCPDLQTCGEYGNT
jgi:hypothetical protein